MLYPPNWVVWLSGGDGAQVISNVLQDSQANPEGLAGACKITAISMQKDAVQSLEDWLSADLQGSSVSTLAPITINGLVGLREVGGESASTDNVYIELSNTSVLSVGLVCGSDSLVTGEATFSNILASIRSR